MRFAPSMPFKMCRTLVIILQGIHHSVARLLKLVRQEQQAGVQVERIVLVGFDQGGAVSLAALLKSKLPFAGVVGMGTYMPLRSEHRNMTKDVRAAEMQTPVLLCHGLYDHHIRYVRHSTQTCPRLQYSKYS